jgi:hypothetical protein
MGQIGVGVLWFAIILASWWILRSRRRLLDALIEAIENFRGGPPTAMHPSPSNDCAVLRGRPRKTEA